MPKKNLYFGRLTPGGTANILVELLGRDRHQRFVDPCPMAFVSDGTLTYPYHYMITEYVSEINDRYQVGFRSTPWHDNLDHVKSLSQRYAPQTLWLATYSDHTFQTVINNVECLSISVNYSQDDYDFMRSKWTRWMTGVIMTDVRCQDMRRRFGSALEVEQYLAQYGSAEFGYDLPRSMHTRADIEINLRDLFDRPSLQDILDQMDCDIAEHDWYFYEKYLECSG